MNSQIQKLFDAIRLYKFGFINVFINKCFSRYITYHVYLIYKFDLADEVIPQDQVIIKKVQNLRGELFKKFRKKFPSHEFLSMFNQQHNICYVAISDGEIVAYAWVAEKEFFIEGINYIYPLKKDEIFLYSCFVTRSHRGKGIHSAMINERLNDYIKDGRYTSAYVGVLSVNKGSIKGIEKAGFKKINKIRYVKLLNKEFWSYKK
ncbi:MAG: GNAT family N-acetyltransferase [Balneolaceae bacterium]